MAEQDQFNHSADNGQILLESVLALLKFIKSYFLWLLCAASILCLFAYLITANTKTTYRGYVSLEPVFDQSPFDVGSQPIDWINEIVFSNTVLLGVLNTDVEGILIRDLMAPADSLSLDTELVQANDMRKFLNITNNGHYVNLTMTHHDLKFVHAVLNAFVVQVWEYLASDCVYDRPTYSDVLRAAILYSIDSMTSTRSKIELLDNLHDQNSLSPEQQLQKQYLLHQVTLDSLFYTKLIEPYQDQIRLKSTYPVFDFSSLEDCSVDYVKLPTATKKVFITVLMVGLSLTVLFARAHELARKKHSKAMQQ